jgi:AraC-like DNA-binding protein
MHFKTEFILPLLKSTITEEFPFFDPEAEHIVNVTDEESELIQQAFRDIITEYGRFSHERDYVLRNYIHILLLRIREIYRPHARRMGEGATRAMQIAGKFRHLVEKNFLEMREVQQYAAQLHVTPKHLSDCVKTATGKSPRQVINDMLLLEAKVLLGSTDLTVTAIAGQLGFEDQSHFHRFIRLHTGLTPIQLRRKN